MLSTLFYDDVETDAVLRIPQTSLSSPDTSSPVQASATGVTAEHYVVNRLCQEDLGDAVKATRGTFHGTLDIPELDAVLLWWTSGLNSMLNVLAVNSQDAATISHSSHCQILPIQLPVSSGADLLTCGLTRQAYGGQCIAVAWLTKSFECGMVGITVQRDGCGMSTSGLTGRSSTHVSASSTAYRNTRGKLLLVVEQQRCVNRASLADVQQVFASEGCRTAYTTSANGLRSRDEELEREADRTSYQTGVGNENLALSACLLSEVPVEGRDVGTIFMITNGVSLWRATLFLDGHVTHDAFVDNKRYQRRNVSHNHNGEANDMAQEGLLGLIDSADLLHCSNIQTWPSLQQLARESISNISLSPFNSLAEGRSSGSDSTEKSKPRCTSSWISSFLSGKSRMHNTPAVTIGGVIPKRRYLCVSAVLNSPGWFALLRWDGLLEFYDGTSADQDQLLEIVPTCHLRDLSGSRKSASFWQWSRFSPERHMVDIVTTIVSARATTSPYSSDAADGVGEQQQQQQEQRIMFTSVPTNLKLSEPGEALEETIALRNAVEVSPPYPSCVLMGCTTAAADDTSSTSSTRDRRLTLLWGALPSYASGSPSMQSSHRRCVAALLQNELPSFARRYQSVLQTLETSEVQETSYRGGERTPVASRTFFADGGSLCAIHTHREVTIFVEEYMDYHRLHAVEPAPALSIEGVMETVTLQPPQRVLFQAPEALLEARFPSKGLRSLHLTPSDTPPCCRTDFLEEQDDDDALEGQSPLDREREEEEEEEEDVLSAESFSSFFAILEALERHPEGADLIGDLMREILEGRTALLTVERFRQELKLDPFLSKKLVTPALVRKGLRAALTYVWPTSPMRQPSFFSFSRYYVYHDISRSLLYRLAFVGCLYLGWCSTGVPLSNADGVCAQLVFSMEYLAAAFFVSQTAGPELVTLGARLASCGEGGSKITTLSFKDAVLSAFLSPDVLHTAPESRMYRCLHVALGLYGCSRGQFHNSVTLVPRCISALEVWASHMSQRVPLMKHFLLLKEIESGRSNTTAEIVLPYCWQIMESIAALPSTTMVVDVLLGKGFLLTDCTGNSTSFSGMRLDELQELLHSYPEVAPKLYAIGLLRRLVAPRGAMLLASASSVSTFFMAELLTVLQCVEVVEEDSLKTGGTPYNPSAVTSSSLSSVVTGLRELQVDVLLALSLAAWQDGEFLHAFHHIENAYRILSKSATTPSEQDKSPVDMSLTNRFTDLNRVVSEIVHLICHSQSVSALHVFQKVPSLSPEVEEWVTQKWADEILLACAEGPRRSIRKDAGAPFGQEEPFCFVLVYGLYGFFMQRHAYGQCGRVLSALAKSLRCSPWSRQRAPLIGRLMSLALHAVEMINTVSHISSGEENAPATQLKRRHQWANEISSGAATATTEAPFSSTGTNDHLVVSDALSPADLPWLRLRVHQAQCEASLWSLGIVVDGWVDLWVEEAPYANVCAAAMKLLEVLEYQNLWKEAFRFSILFNAVETTRCIAYANTSGGMNGTATLPDPCAVLSHWVVYLLRLPQSLHSNRCSSWDMEDQWDALLVCCAECSSLENQFLGFHSAVTAALKTDYARTDSKLLEAYRLADPYCAMKTLLQIYSSFQMDLMRYSIGNEKSSSANFGIKEECLLLSCLVCVDAAYIAVDVLDNAGTSDSFFSFTAGVFDTLALAFSSLGKSCPAVLLAADEENIHQDFLNKLTQVLTSHTIP